MGDYSVRLTEKPVFVKWKLSDKNKLPDIVPKEKLKTVYRELNTFPLFHLKIVQRSEKFDILDEILLEDISNKEMNLFVETDLENDISIFASIIKFNTTYLNFCFKKANLEKQLENLAAILARNRNVCIDIELKDITIDTGRILELVRRLNDLKIKRIRFLVDISSSKQDIDYFNYITDFFKTFITMVDIFAQINFDIVEPTRMLRKQLNMQNYLFGSLYIDSFGRVSLFDYIQSKKSGFTIFGDINDMWHQYFEQSFLDDLERAIN